MNEIVFAVLIVWAVMAVPSITHGVVLARRSGRSVGLAVIVCLLLPFLGLLFFAAQPPGRRRVVGLGHYCSSMLTVAAVMAVISIFLDWVVAEPGVLPDADAYGPTDVVLLAVLIGVWALCLLAGSIGITRGGDMVVGIVLGIVVSLSAGVLAALTYLWGSAGVFVPELRDAQDQLVGSVHVGPGGWVALITLIVSYVCVVLLPFGLRFVPDPPAEAQPQHQEFAQHGPPGMYGAPQQWAPQQPQQQQPPQQQWPGRGGAGW